MKALVIEAPGRYGIRERPRPVPLPGQALVRVRRYTICTGDLELLDGTNTDEPIAYPLVPGHEWSGVVEAAPDAPSLEGKGVVGVNQITCLACKACLEGRWNLCPSAKELGFTLDGCAAEFLVTNIRNLRVVPPGLSLEDASALEPLAVCVSGFLDARMRAGDRVLVVGGGAIGLFSAQVARALGASSVILAGRREKRLLLAREVGADVVIDVAKTPLSEAIRTGAVPPVDLAVETSGNPAAFADCVDACARGGRVLLLGTYVGARPPVALNAILLKGLSVIGSVGSYPAAWDVGLALAARGLVRLGPLITHVLPFADYEKGFGFVRGKKDDVVRVSLQI